ncbi:terpene synthase family protein [Nocardia wallacei]|uniref:terpene synthase family protein n=1 Tax=Nocardia wallacei TaxID=480035 RepID=UPI0024572539|nr:terpene synthase family protein [Nocardia wallacei]
MNYLKSTKINHGSTCGPDAAENSVWLTSWQIPTSFPVPFIARINRYTGRASQRFWEWIELRDLAPTGRSKERLRRSGIELASSYCWPWADHATLLEGMKWMFLFFRFDDQMEEGVARRDFARVERAAEGIVNVLHGGRPVSSGTLIRELHRVWLHTKAERPDDWVGAFRDHYSDLVRSYNSQARRNYNSSMTMPMTEYETFRQSSYGMEWVYDFMEAANTAVGAGYIPSSARRSPTMSTIRWAASLQQALLNDIFSAPRESFQRRTVNAVMIFQEQYHCSPQQAVRRVLDRMAELLSIYRVACADIRNETGYQQPGTATTLDTLLANIDAVIGGNHDWHHIVMRYATDDVSSADGAYTYPDDM